MSRSTTLILTVCIKIKSFEVYLIVDFLITDQYQLHSSTGLKVITVVPRMSPS